MSMCYINTRSLKNKTIYLNDYITTNKYDLIAFSETWLNSTDDNAPYINALLPEGYDLKHVDRENGQRGGGVALAHKVSVRVANIQSLNYKQFEAMRTTLSINNKSILLFVVYRPPPSNQNGLTTSSFIEEFAEFVSEQIVNTAEIILTGDINLHLDVTSNPNTQKFTQILKSSGLQQHAVGPTHYLGHTLDILISRDNSDIIYDVVIKDIGLCDNDGNLSRDHFAICCNIRQSRPVLNRKSIAYRPYKSIDIDRFRDDIRSSHGLNDTTGTLNDLTHRYISGLSDLIDLHAPVTNRLVTLRPHAPWYDEEVRDAKHERRKLERTWRRSKQPDDHEAYRKQCSVVGKQLFRAKSQYYSTKIQDIQGDQKALSSITNKLLVNQNQKKLPTSDNDTTLACTFSDYFHNKINVLRSKFVDTINTDLDTRPITNVKFNDLRPATIDEVKKTILSCSSTSCQLDPVPTWLLKLCLNELLPLIAAIMNKSLSTGEFPTDLKKAIIKPHIKRPNLDTEEMKNYRPVSNLHFVSKILEKLVVTRIEEHMSNCNLYDPLQSAYRSKHSTETAVLKIQNDIIGNLDMGMCTVLTSLDLSAAFDTVDHAIFLRRLNFLYGVDGVPLNWFKSYFNDRDHRVCVHEALSPPRVITCGVPQGSVLGARLYTMYIYPLTQIIQRHGI